MVIYYISKILKGDSNLYMDDEKVTTQSTVHEFDTVQEALRNSNIEKLQLSSMYGIFSGYGTFDKSEEVKVSRIEDIDEHNGF